MTGGGWKAGMAAGLLLCACSRPAPPEASLQDIGVFDSGGLANPSVARLDPVSADFCQARAYGAPELIAFLNAVETCDLLTSPTQRAEARCNTLGANEIRLRAQLGTDGAAISALNRARSRPWPACPAVMPPPVAEPDEAVVEETGLEEEPIEPVGSGE